MARRGTRIGDRFASRPRLTPPRSGYQIRSVPKDTRSPPPPTRPEERAMAVKRPTPSQLRAVANDLGITLTDEDVTPYLGLMAGTITAYDPIDAMPHSLPQVKYPRTPGHRPDGAQNEYNAWYVKTH